MWVHRSNSGPSTWGTLLTAASAWMSQKVGLRLLWVLVFTNMSLTPISNSLSVPRPLRVTWKHPNLAWFTAFRNKRLNLVDASHVWTLRGPPGGAISVVVSSLWPLPRFFPVPVLSNAWSWVVFLWFCFFPMPDEISFAGRIGYHVWRICNGCRSRYLRPLGSFSFILLP